MRIEPSAEPGFCDTTFTWHDPEPTRPCHGVLVRLVGVTDHAYDDGDIGPYLMRPGPGGSWRLTLRLPSTLRTSYQICPIRDEPGDAHPSEAHPSEPRWLDILAAGGPDPLNPATLAAGTTYGNPGPASILELPDAPAQPWQARRPDVPRGDMVRHELAADDGEPSIVHIYVPVGHQPTGEPAALLVLFDGKWWLSIDVAATFDNLIADGVTPPMVVAAIESIHGAARWRALTHPEVFEPFVVGELLPFIEARWNVSRDPRANVLAGQSLGGLVVSHLARSHPERFGNVIGLSVAAWWGGDDDGGLSGQQVVDAFATSGSVPVRFFLEVGSREAELLASVRTMRDVLAARGYDVRYREYDGGHDLACWRGGLADGLVGALGSEPAVSGAATPAMPR